MRLGRTGSVALITGATAGTGLATARSMVAEGVRVVTVSRGPDGPNSSRAAAERPLKRFAEPQEIADAIVFLSRPAASQVTGAEWSLSGGSVP